MDGAFNSAGIKECITNVKAAIASFNGEGFCILSDATTLQGATPNAYTEIESFNMWLNDQALIAKAIVIQSPVTLEIFDIRAPSRAQQNIRSFNNRDDAFHWLSMTCESNDIDRSVN